MALLAVLDLVIDATVLLRDHHLTHLQLLSFLILRLLLVIAMQPSGLDGHFRLSRRFRCRLVGRRL